MPEEIVVQQGAPTLAGIKTGSLFPCPYEDRECFLRELRDLNRRLSPKGLCLLPLHDIAQGRALLYLYRPERLKADLRDPQALELLEKEGYPCESCAGCVCRLIHRLEEQSGFPHEIGLFLSYPPEDVRGFIENRAENYRCAGLWKVYGDVSRAQALFARFRQCTEIYCRRWQEGIPLEQLAAAV